MRIVRYSLSPQSQHMYLYIIKGVIRIIINLIDCGIALKKVPLNPGSEA